ncbi:MAG: GNAT family N-acetyltransferase [Paracoccus sp. (in: a-proteobacteria)]
MKQFPQLKDGLNIRLRLIQPGDAAYVVGLRTNPAYGRHLSTVAGTVADQCDWINQYKLREQTGIEAYYIIERRNDNYPCGTIRIYDIKSDRFTWGSFVLDQSKPSKAALEAALLSFEIGFLFLDLPLALVDVRIANQRAADFYLRLGMQEIQRSDEDIYLEFKRHTFEESHRALWDIICESQSYENP